MLIGFRPFPALCAALLFSGIASAQTVDVSLPPATLIPNYNRVPVGQEEALEGGAYVSRANGATANWYNPAGLAHTKTAVINASVSGYELSSIDLSGFDETGRTRRVGTVPGFFGIVLGEPVLKKKNLAVGISVTRQIAWDAAFSAQLQATRANGAEHIIYDSDVGFSTVIPQIGVGYALSDRWRIGVGLGVAVTDIARNVTISDDLIGPTVNNTQLSTSRLNGVVAHLVPSAGVQFDITDRWTTGLTVRSIGIRVTGTGSAQINAESFVDNQVTSVTYLDTKARFNYRPPLQVAAGISYRSDRFGLELDASYYDSLGDYELFQSDQPVHISTSSPGGARTDTDRPFPSLTYRTKPAFNAALGGRFNLTKALQLHAGVYTDLSPVSSSNRVVFQQINLYGGTFGASLSGKSVSGMIGVIYVRGRTGPFNLNDNLTGGPTETHLTINSLALLYALSYEF